MLLCLVGLLAGCGTDKAASPGSLPPLSGSPRPVTPSAVAVAPVPKPADADAFTSEGAASFVRYYIDVINQAVYANDPQRLAELSDPACGGCQNYINSILDTAKRKGQVVSGRIQVINSVAPPLERGETTVLLDFQASEYVSKLPNGQVLDRFAASGVLTAELRCVRHAGTWIVAGFRLARAAGQ